MADNRNYNSNSRKRGQQAAGEQQVVEAIFGSLWKLIKMLFGGGKKTGGGNAAKAQIAAHWQAVEGYMDTAATQAIAISEADKLLDAGLQAYGIAGETLGERLKAAKNTFPPDLYNQLWDAHKLRNSLAHQVGASVSPSEAAQAISSFRRGLQYIQMIP